MSGQWEVVGKKKDRAAGKQGSSAQKPSKSQNTNTFTSRDIRVEEVLPMSQLKNLYATGKSNNKENRKPQEKPKQENPKQENGVNKKVQKKPEKPQEQKPKPPKSIESALNSISVDEFVASYEKNKSLFPDTPIVWLKELAQFLNVKVPVDVPDPVFSNRPETYPLSVVPTAIRNVLERAVNESGSDNAAVFYDICLTTMANDMNKGASALGHKFFLQYIAGQDPKVVVNNVAKNVQLRNSYQNRQNVGLSILWALGQAGHKDLNVGVKVFQEIFYPVIEMKNYSRYVHKYLIDLINRQKDGVSLSRDQYLQVLDSIYSSRKNAPTDLDKELYGIVTKVNALAIKNSVNEKYHSYVELFLRKIAQNTHDGYRNALCEVLVSCFDHDQTALATWGKVYSKSVLASGLLLSYIEKNWKTVSNKINSKVLSDLLNTFSSVNDELKLKRRKEDGLDEAISAIQKLVVTMTQRQKPKRSSFFCNFTILLATLFAALWVYKDVTRTDWQNSVTYKTLNQTGICGYTSKAIERAQECSLWLHERIEERFPGVTETYLIPYLELFRDLGIIARNMITRLSAHVMPYVHTAADISMEYILKAMVIVLNITEQVAEYLQVTFREWDNAAYPYKKVVRQYFDWAYEKVTSAIK